MMVFLYDAPSAQAAGTAVGRASSPGDPSRLSYDILPCFAADDNRELPVCCRAAFRQATERSPGATQRAPHLCPSMPGAGVHRVAVQPRLERTFAIKNAEVYRPLPLALQCISARDSRAPPSPPAPVALPPVGAQGRVLSWSKGRVLSGSARAGRRAAS